MPRTAKIFMTNRSQAVRLPKEYQFSTDEVFIRKEGEDVILSPRPANWRPYLETAPVASTRSWKTSRTRPCRSASPDGPLHAGHGHLLVHHEGSNAPLLRVCKRCRSRGLHVGHHEVRVLYGVEVSPRRSRMSTTLAAFLPYVEVRDFPGDAASHYAEIRADLKGRGVLIGANDLFIAAHARSLGLTLVTNNTAEFGRVRGLAIDNWTLPGRRSRATDDQ